MKLKEELRRMKEQLAKKILFLIAFIGALSFLLYIPSKLILFVSVYFTITLYATFVYA
jgi:hypothetical protein